MLHLGLLYFAACWIEKENLNKTGSHNSDSAWERALADARAQKAKAKTRKNKK